MAKNKKGLGMGLDALLKMNVKSDQDQQTEAKSKEKVIAGFVELPINNVSPNPDQPRKNFDDESLNELALSIKNFGIIQPITVVEKENRYEIVAGERRFRAAKKIGLKNIPVIIKDVTQKEELEISLVENIQRENLNPIEEALAYSSLIEAYNITQEELSQRVGKSRTAITNLIRLLSLDDQIRKWIMEGKLTSGHARTVLAIEDKKEHIHFTDYIMKKELSVREAEVLSKKWKKTDNAKKSSKVEKDPEIKRLEKDLQQKIQTRVSISGDSKKGKILIDYFSQEELERILEILGIDLK